MSNKKNVNLKIRENIEALKIDAINGFLKLKNPHPLFLEVFNDLRNIDAEKTKKEFLEDLKNNCNKYWTNIAEGCNPGDKIKALLFEYDYICLADTEALAYGIIGGDFKIKTFSYGCEYSDFASGIESSPGVTLTTLSPFAKFDEKLPIQYKGFDFYEEEGFSLLKEAFIFTSYLILHDSFALFVDTLEFEKINKEPVLHVLIGEHDCGNEMPIYYAAKNQKILNAAISKQGEGVDYDEYWAMHALKRKLGDMIDDEMVSEIDEILKGLMELSKNENFSGWAAFKLANIYFKGFGVDKDENMAVGYLEIAADADNYVAKGYLGMCYYLGRGKQKDLDKALELLNAANNYYMLQGEYTHIIKKIEEEKMK